MNRSIFRNGHRELKRWEVHSVAALKGAAIFFPYGDGLPFTEVLALFHPFYEQGMKSVV
jgi:hypothetical protein